MAETPTPAPAQPAAPAAPAAAPVGAPVETTGTQQPDVPARQEPPGFLWQMMPFLFVFIIFWFILIRPQRRREQERLALLDKLQKNDRVMTSGGVFGTVHSVKDNVIILKIDEDKDVKIRVQKSCIVHVERDGDVARNGRNEK
jgi:preprotein translocase subunit YajC